MSYPDAMLRKIIHTQHEPTLVLDLPKNLQGRRIEVIAFPIEEEVTIQNTPSVMGDFFGTLTSENAEKLQDHAKQSRSEWDRDF
jgi:hypothetical protein